MNVLLLVAGLAMLIVGANALVLGASTVANRFGVAPLVIGLTIVSFGTSLPELLVTLLAGLQHKPDLAIANVVGSNIANVLLVLGVAAIVRPLPVRDSTVVSEIPFSLTAALLVGFLANAALFSAATRLSISRFDGVILLFFFLLFILYVYRTSRATATLEIDAGPSANWSLGRAAAFILAGVIALYMGGQWVVTGALAVARLWQVDNATVGLTIVAIGTSSPELFASAVAAWRNQADIAVGNVVGSNIFNLLWILGLTSSVVELPFKAVGNTDLLLVIASSALIIVAMVVSRKRAILRSHGVIFVALYVGYMVHLVMGR